MVDGLIRCQWDTAYFNINVVNWQVHETLAKVGNFNAAQQEIEKPVACNCEGASKLKQLCIVPWKN